MQKKKWSLLNKKFILIKKGKMKNEKGPTFFFKINIHTSIQIMNTKKKKNKDSLKWTLKKLCPLNIIWVTSSK
jgi:uncharacterized OsmC-like protein